MSKLPVISGQQCIRALQRVDFAVRRQSGSHIIMQRKEPFAMVSVPNHRTVKPSTLRKIIKDAGLTVDEFLDLLK
jgi:predicted RNA binding protein YcfA (HicA-like mRNA interferase family)